MLEYLENYGRAHNSNVDTIAFDAGLLLIVGLLLIFFFFGLWYWYDQYQEEIKRKKRIESKKTKVIVKKQFNNFKRIIEHMQKYSKTTKKRFKEKDFENIEKLIRYFVWNNEPKTLWEIYHIYCDMQDSKKLTKYMKTISNKMEVMKNEKI